ncbi:hypothetical protein TNCV_2624771 [Trichonephila clavipes]|nr:hypothetical protein TNCV_2624771 [Trichonephila clavipes]
MKEGLIASSYECPKCNEQMGLNERKSVVLDGDVEKKNTSIHYVVKKYKKQKSVDNKLRSGRPKEFSEAVERWLVHEIKKEPKTYVSNLAKVECDDKIIVYRKRNAELEERNMVSSVKHR